MNKFDEERLYELRNKLYTELPEVIIYTDFEGTYIHITYDGKSVCKIRTNGTGYDVTYTSEFGDEGRPHKTWLPGYRSIKKSIRIAIQKYEKGQKDMMTLGDLRDYIQQELGNLVAAVYEPGKTGPGPNSDRIKINRGGLWVCSIYRNKHSNGNLFTVIFYDPFICRSAGYSPVVNLTLEEIPKAIKNRINICDSTSINNGDNRIAVDIDVSDDAIEKEIYMMTARGSGKTRWISEQLKNAWSFKDRIKDVIFNDPATIVFWIDDSKTVVKCQKGETFDPEKGLAMAISKKVLGNDYGYYETFAKHVGRYNKKHKEK